MTVARPPLRLFTTDFANWNDASPDGTPITENDGSLFQIFKSEMSDVYLTLNSDTRKQNKNAVRKKNKNDPPPRNVKKWLESLPEEFPQT